MPRSMADCTSMAIGSVVHMFGSRFRRHGVGMEVGRAFTCVFWIGYFEFCGGHFRDGG